MATYTDYKIVRRHGDGRVLVRFSRVTIGEPYDDGTGALVTPMTRQVLSEVEYRLPRYTANDIRDFLDEALPEFAQAQAQVLPEQVSRQPRPLSKTREADIKAGRDPSNG